MYGGPEHCLRNGAQVNREISVAPRGWISLGSSRGSAKSVVSKEIPTFSEEIRGPSRSPVAVIADASPVVASANDCSGSVGVGFGSAVCSDEGDGPSESDPVHPAKRRASAKTLPWILRLMSTAITLLCSLGINNWSSLAPIFASTISLSVRRRRPRGRYKFENALHNRSVVFVAVVERLRTPFVFSIDPDLTASLCYC